MMLRLPLSLCLAFLLLDGAPGDSDAPNDPEVLKSIIADIEAGWENGDPSPFETHYLDFDGARYIESGGQNVGLRDLIDHHVVPEGDVLESLALTFEDIDVHFENDFAWAIADVRVQATVKADGRKIDKQGFETFLFRFVDASWKVVHTHASTRPTNP